MRFLFLGLLAATLFAQPPQPRKETVVVTGTFEPVPLDESDRSVHSRPVRGEDRILANTAVDFLNRDASIDLRQRGPNNIQTDVSIRGGTFGQTLVLLNGFRLNDVQSGHHNMDLPVPLESVDRIEVLKGAGSTLYGSDAIGGVVHVITKPPESAELRLRGALGNFGVNQQRVSASYARPGLSQQLAASRDFSTGFIPNRDYRNLAVSSLTDYKRTSVILGLSDKPFGAEQFYGNFNSWERTKTWLAALRQGFGEKTTVSFAFRRHTDLFVLYRDRPQVFTNRHAVEGWQGSLRRVEDLGHNTRLHYGVEAIGDSIVSTNLGNHSRQRGSGWAALDMRALRRFSLSLGAREEVYGSLDHQFTPSLAGGAWLTPKLKLRASVSRAFRLPSFTDLYYQDPANRGTPDLRPEKAWSYEGGADWNNGGMIRASAGVFQRRETDGIDYVRTNPSDIWRATNFQRLRFTGFEGSLAVRARPYHRLELSYTALRGAQQATAGIFSRYALNYPRHTGIAGWQASLPRGIVTRARVGGTARLARDAYVVVDIYAARARGRVQPFISVTNLGDRRYQEILGVAMPGRSIVSGVEFSLQ